jgi:hypothetical protein
MKSNRGTFGLETVLILALIAGTVVGYNKFFGHTPGDKKGSPIENVENINSEKKEKVEKVVAKIDKENYEQLNTAQAGVYATGEAINRAKNKAASGSIPTRELDTASDINEITKSAIDAGVDHPVDPKLLKWFIESIEKKNSDIAHERDIGERMLKNKDNELMASMDREKKAVEEKNSVIAEYSKKLSKAESERDRWALERDATAAKWDNLIFWIWVAAGVYLFAILAPIIAKVFPAFGPIASVAGAVVAPMVAFGKAKADDLAKDLVSLNNESKKFIESIDPAKVEDFKKHVSTWWENDTSSTHEVEKIKKTLRL